MALSIGNTNQGLSQASEGLGKADHMGTMDLLRDIIPSAKNNNGSQDIAGITGFENKDIFAQEYGGAGQILKGVYA